MTSERFSVQSISYNEQREISSLVIVNGRGLKVFEMNRKQRQKQEQKGEQQGKQNKNNNNYGNSNRNSNGITEVQRIALEKELQRTGVLMEAVLGRYNIRSLEEMSKDVYTKALAGLKKTATKAA